MRSETTADMSDSIAPSIATVNAGPSSPCTRLACQVGITKCGNPLGIPPNRVPIVSTGNLKRKTATVAPSMATIGPGMRLETARHSNKTATVQLATSPARGVQVGEATASAFNRNQNSPGTLCKCKPQKSLIWVLAINTAIPFVKPSTTGRGINFTAEPMLVTPNTTSSTPAIIVHMKSPSMPCTATIPEMTTTNAPVGPPICVFDPPSAEIRNPVTMAQ